jgi:hypothetical protein
MIWGQSLQPIASRLQARLFYHNQFGTDSYLSMASASRYAVQGCIANGHAPTPGGPNLADASQPTVLRKFCSEIQDMVLCLTRMLGWSYGQHQ